MEVIGQEEEIRESDSRLQVPFGVRDERVAPVLARVDSLGAVQVRIVVLIVIHGVRVMIEDGEEGGPQLVGLRGQERAVRHQFLLLVKQNWKKTGVKAPNLNLQQ